MKKLFVIALIVLTTTSLCLAKNPVGDWQAVRFDIPQGWQITVVTSFTFPCIFQNATEDELTCGPLQHFQGASASHEIHIRRHRVRVIRLARRAGPNMPAAAAGADRPG